MEKCRSGKLNLPKNLKGNARELVKILLTDDPQLRPSIAEIKQHAFFKGLDWIGLKKRQIDPPHKPDYYDDHYGNFNDFNENSEEYNDQEGAFYGSIGEQPSLSRSMLAQKRRSSQNSQLRESPDFNGS